jgi:integrase
VTSPGWLCDQLAAMLAARAEGKPGGIGRHDHLFVRQSGIPLHRDKFRQHIIRPALKAAGLPDSLRTYDLCHSHGSLLIDQGANLLAISQRMGHSDPAVTLRVYGHLFAGVQEDLTNRLDGLRTGRVDPAKPGDIVPIKPRGNGQSQIPHSSTGRGVTHSS